MDISFYNSFLTDLATQESQVSTLQQQISTGSTAQTAAQNPTAYETASLANDQIAQLNGQTTTQSTLQSQLGSATSAYSSMISLFDNVQSIVEQGLNGTANSQNLAALSSQTQSASQQLLTLGNTQLPNQTYLFGGTRGTIAPFQVDESGNVSYFGDSGQSQATIDESATANTLVSGSVFTSAMQGDGTSYVTANADNTGTGEISQQGLSNLTQANAFQASALTSAITISVSTDATSGATVLKAEQNGKPLSFNTSSSQTSMTLNTSAGGETNFSVLGMNFSVSGTPKSGDQFTISPARPQSAFQLLQSIRSALSATRATPAQAAQTNQILNQSLAGIGQYQQAITIAQAQNGVTLQAISNAQTNSNAQKIAAQTTVDNATSVNMPAAITALNETMSAIEASMKTFAAAQNLSLFKYL